MASSSTALLFTINLLSSLPLFLVQGNAYLARRKEVFREDRQKIPCLCHCCPLLPAHEKSQPRQDMPMKKNAFAGKRSEKSYPLEGNPIKII
jgi:hypothetical protein